LVGTLSNIGQAVLPGGKEAINVGDLGGLQFPKVVVDPSFCYLRIYKFHGWIRAIALHRIALKSGRNFECEARFSHNFFN